MEFHSFIPVFASLLILFQLATPSDLPPPTISVTPAKLCYLIGDTVSIVCAAPPGTDNVVGFRFSGASQWVTDIRTSRRTFTHTFNVTGPRDGGAHRCSYAVHRHSPTHSPASQAVLINVRDRPNQPILMVTPSSVTVEGQPLVLLCTATPDDAERRFQFFQDDLEVTDGVQEGSGAPGGIQLRVDRSSQNWTGNFSCRYDEMTEGRWIQSYPSQAIQVIVKDPSPPPYLSVDPPSGVVVAGHRLQLSCTAPHRDFRRRFRFFRDGVEALSPSPSSSCPLPQPLQTVQDPKFPSPASYPPPLATPSAASASSMATPNDWPSLLRVTTPRSLSPLPLRPQLRPDTSAASTRRKWAGPGCSHHPVPLSPYPTLLSLGSSHWSLGSWWARLHCSSGSYWLLGCAGGGWGLPTGGGCVLGMTPAPSPWRTLRSPPEQGQDGCSSPETTPPRWLPLP